MRFDLTGAAYVAVHELLDVAASTRFKIQIIDGVVEMSEGGSAPERGGYTLRPDSQMYLSDPTLGALYVRAMSSSASLEIIVADTGAGIAPYTSATGSSGGGGGSEETPASVKQKYESNPNTNAFTDADKAKLENAGEGVTIEQVQSAANQAQANAISHSDGKRINDIQQSLSGQQLTTTISNSDGESHSATVTLPTSGGGGGVSSVDVSYADDSRLLTVSVDGIEGSEQLDFIGVTELAETQQATLDQAKEYTDQEIAKIPNSGDVQFGVTDVKVGTIVGLADETVADDSMLACDGKQYLKTDYPELYAAIGDDYQSVDTEPDNFNVPKIENTRSVSKLSDLSFDHLLNEYANGLTPSEQQMAGIYAEGKAHFVLANNGNIILGVAEDDRVDGTLIGSGYQYVSRFALAYENESIHVLGFHLDKVYHSVVTDGEVTQSMVENTSPFHNPLYVVYMENASALVAVDRDRSGAIIVKAAGVSLKQNGNVEIDETRADSIAFPADVTPLNLCCTAAEGQGFRAVTVAGSDGNTHVFPLESFFLLFEFNTYIRDIQITGISQSFPIKPLGTNVQYFCTDNASLYTIHMGVTHQDRDIAHLEFQRNIEDVTDTANLAQPLVADGDNSFKKAAINHETGDIRVYKSELDDVDFVVQNTLHYIKAKIDYTKSPIVETVVAEYENSQLTVTVNDVTSNAVTIQSGGSATDPRVETLLGQVQALETLTQQQSSAIDNLNELVEYLQKNAFGSYELHSGAANRLDMRMKRIDGTVEDDVQSITLDGTHPDPTDPDTPDNSKTYTVWHGWTKSNLDELEEAEFKNTSEQERTESSGIYGDNYAGSIEQGQQHITSARYENTREQPQSADDAAYMYLVFPREITAREIKHVNYNGSNATWRSRELEVGGVPYKIFMTDQVNIVPIYDLGLAE